MGIAASGLRAFAGLYLMDSGEGLPEAMRQGTDAALAETEALGDLYDGAAEGRLRYALNPRFILTCSDPLWTGLRDLALRRGWPVHTHALEQQDETAVVRSLKGGRDEIHCFDDQGLLSTDPSLTASGSPTGISAGCGTMARASFTAPAPT